MAVYPLGVNVALAGVTATLHAVELPTDAEPVPEPSAPVKNATAIAPTASALSVPSPMKILRRVLNILEPPGDNDRCIPVSFFSSHAAHRRTRAWASLRRRNALRRDLCIDFVGSRAPFTGCDTTLCAYLQFVKLTNCKIS